LWKKFHCFVSFSIVTDISYTYLYCFQDIIAFITFKNSSVSLQHTSQFWCSVLSTKIDQCVAG